MPYADPPLAGRYLLLDVVGVGGMGAVWRAWDLRELRFVAVKVAHRLDAPHLLRFVREQAVRIEHPHVAAPTGWVADDDRVAFAMELARGGSVADLLVEHGPLPATYVVELLGQLLDGLAAVHAAGVVHRDLKPANLLLEATGRGTPHLRIGDFGVAAAQPASGETPGVGVGTAGYAPPEQLAGAPPHPAQDLYAVGVLGRELLGSPHDARPDELRALLACLSDPDPARRPAGAVEARELLDACPSRGRGLRPAVPDRLGPVAVPVPSARRAAPPRAVRLRARVVLGACFLASAAGGASAVALLFRHGVG